MMKNWWLLVFLLAVFVFGCYKEKIVLNELQVTACESAYENNNCERLDDLGLVSGRDCCYVLNKCCGSSIAGSVVSGSLSDIQITACQSASVNNKCGRLSELGIVTEDECCSAFGKCCSLVVNLADFKSVLIQAIKSYFSNSPVLTTVELKDLIVVYFSTPGENVDLSGKGEYSGENLNDIYSKAQTTPSCTDECSPSGAKQCYNTASYQTCGNYDDDSRLEWGTTANCPSGQTCSNGQCVSPTQNCAGTCKASPCSSYQSCSSASGSCTTGYCCSGTCSFVSNDTQRHKGCYNSDIYWLDISNKPVELIQECNVDCAGGWPLNSFCYERSDGKVEVRAYPECFYKRCIYSTSGVPYCESDKNNYPEGIESIEYWACNHIFTINSIYKDNPKYWYIGEPTPPILNLTLRKIMAGACGVADTYIDQDHPKIINCIAMSMLYWDEKGFLVRSSSDTLAKPPCRILTDLIPFYEKNNIVPYQAEVCDNKCSQIFSDSFFYRDEDFVFARCV